MSEVAATIQALAFGIQSLALLVFIMLTGQLYKRIRPLLTILEQGSPEDARMMGWRAQMVNSLDMLRHSVDAANSKADNIRAESERDRRVHNRTDSLLEAATRIGNHAARLEELDIVQRIGSRSDAEGIAAAARIAALREAADLVRSPVCPQCARIDFPACSHDWHRARRQFLLRVA